MNIVGVDHVQITIPREKEDEARRFYCSVLGLKEVEKPEILKPRGGFWLQAGSLQVHVGTEPGVDRTRTKAHVAYEVSDLAQARSELEAVGIRIVEPPPVPGIERIELRDPFGNRLELLQRVSENGGKVG